jgi:YtkA-like
MSPRIFAALLLLGCGASEPAQTLATGSVVSEQQNYTITVTPVREIARGMNGFAAEHAIPEGTRITRGEALMPAHGHMAAPAVIRSEGNKTYVERLDLSMPGQWEITLSLAGARGDDALRFAVEVP